VKIGTLVEVSDSGMIYSGISDSATRANIGIVVGKTFIEVNDEDIYDRVDMWVVMMYGITDQFYEEDLLAI